MQQQQERSRIAIVYSTREGHTFEVAGRIGDHLRSAGLAVETFMATEPPESLERFSGIIIAGSVHAGHHDRSLVRFVQQYAGQVRALPNAMISVSFTAARTDETHHHQAIAIVDRFIEETGWHPDMVSLTGGMLAYTRYGFIKKQLMRRIAKQEGAETDTSRDWDLTDWTAVKEFTCDFIAYAEESVNAESDAAHGTRSNIAS